MTHLGSWVMSVGAFSSYRLSIKGAPGITATAKRKGQNLFVPEQHPGDRWTVQMASLLSMSQVRSPQRP